MGVNQYELINYKSYMVILFASLAVSIAIQLVLPFPIGLIVALGLFIVFPLILRRVYTKRLGGGYGGASGSGIKGGGFFGLGAGSGNAGGGNTTVRYVCLVCNNRYKGGSCPRCGSKMKRADF